MAGVDQIIFEAEYWPIAGLPNLVVSVAYLVTLASVCSC